MFISLQINSQRELITNFATTQVTRLETLSTDTTNLLENCRSSIDAAASKNFEVIENMSRLLDVLKSNTESMKTISPTISESIDSVTSSTKNQIEETVKIKDDHEKRSDEQTSKLNTITDDIKNRSDGNRKEISKIIESVNNHTKLFAAAMKSSKVKILEQFNKQKTIATAAFNNIESKIADGIEQIKSSSSDIASVINDADKTRNDDSQNNLNFKRTVSTFVQAFGTSSKKKLDNLRNVVVDFHKKDLKVYTPSGK